MHAPRFSLPFGAVLLLAAASPTLAQDTTAARPDSAADSTARGEVRRIRGVRVVASATRGSYRPGSLRSATRTDTPLRDVPQAATVITRAVIADQAMQSMADVARYIPGVTMGLGEGHRDQPTIRGNSTTADFFVDGMRDDAQYFRDLYNVERVEAVKGANALAFGRGGGGGVINRVSKQAGFLPAASLTIEGGSFEHARETVDLNLPLGDRVAVRLNGMLDRSGGFREFARLRREGISPTATIVAGPSTVVRLDYERFHDERNVDRGIPSFAGAPFAVSRHVFFGVPDSSRAFARVDAAGVTLEHALGGLSLRNATRGVRYDKFYQNVFAGGAVNAAGTQVNLSGYNNATKRDNLFNQTDVTTRVVTGPAVHTLLLGGELSRQSTDNFRQTGYFNGGTATSLAVSVDAPSPAAAVAFRQSATDADNRARVDVRAGYLQDQVAIGTHWQAIAGVRVDRFDQRFTNDRNGEALSRVDRLVSPRGGLVYKPVDAASLYASYSVSHLPSSGDQFSSLTVTAQTLEPERFTNRELGAKWDATTSLSLSAAIYRLDRTRSTAQDPNDASRVVQSGAQRTTGYELGVMGDVTDRWQVAGGYAVQRAVLTSATTAGVAGATAPLVPRHTTSLWNRVQIAPAAGLGLGVVHQARMYAALDNKVVIPAFIRVDAGLFVTLYGQSRLQLNLENLLGAEYFASAHGNNNILPGAPRTLRLSVTAAR